MKLTKEDKKEIKGLIDIGNQEMQKFYKRNVENNDEDLEEGVKEFIQMSDKGVIDIVIRKQGPYK